MVLKELKHQTGVYFMYNTSEIDAEVRVSVKLERENLEIQAVLLTLYECHKAVRASEQHLPKGTGADNKEPFITAEDSERLMKSWEEALLRLDVIHGDNPAYFLMPWRRFFARANLRKHEYEAFMGLCRQIRTRTQKKS